MPDPQSYIAMDDNIIDQTILNALRSAIGEDAMQNFLGRFLEDCRVRTKRITEFYGKGRFSEVELEAHTLGSSAATYGAINLEAICREIEFSKPRRNQNFQERIDRLNVLSEQALQALHEYII
ncbi:MAG: hypothetical protein COA45_11290 [Zetaproteobacteria bacterium]|nr:MAG: hypothetical protein COA45_11290 [Zetaproteobacteria bacterium]